MKNRASILIGMLWCVAILAVVVVGTLHTAHMDLAAGKNFSDKIQARYLALAGIERAEALLYEDALDRSHSGKNHTGRLYDDPEDFHDIQFGRGTWSVLRRGRDDEGDGVIYGVSDEESRLNVNTATADELTKIEGLGSDVATAILGWRGQGNTAAETEYYLSQRPPYRLRGGPFQTVRELLMVRGITPGLLLGRDIHQDGLLDDLSDSPDEPPRYPENVSEGDLGWAGIFTVNSADNNVNASGEDRVNIQTADENALAEVPGITRDIAHAIVSYRAQNRFQSIANLLDVTPPQGNQGPFAAQNSSAHMIDSSLLMKIADDVTATDDKTQTGLVNINTAGATVLECLPGLDRDLAQKIISFRQSSGFFDNIAGLLNVDGMTPDIFKQIAPLLTARSETYRILAQGRIASTGITQRIQVIVRVNLDGVQTLSYREDDL